MRTAAPLRAGAADPPNGPAGPFVKWAGGKGQLLPQLDPYFPPVGSYRRYFEPFLGGGAVFFHLTPPRAMLSDLMEELINVYRVVRDQVDSLIRSLRMHGPTEEHYYQLRDQPGELSDVGRASRFIYLNKWCYNGLYRVNSKGLFNVPRGRYKPETRVFDETNLRNVAQLLARADIRVAPYEEALAEAGSGDFVYLDPPYQPLSPTANFTRYTKDSFEEKDQVLLAKALQELDRRGARFLLNNHDTRGLRVLYQGFRIAEATTNRMINSQAGRRKGTAVELIVTNYEPPARDAW